MRNDTGLVHPSAPRLGAVGILAVKTFGLYRIIDQLFQSQYVSGFWRNDLPLGATDVAIARCFSINSERVISISLQVCTFRALASAKTFRLLREEQQRRGTYLVAHSSGTTRDQILWAIGDHCAALR